MNPVFLKLGPIELHYYGLMYAIAFYVGITLGKKIAKERNFDVELVENYAFVAIISGLIGGRLYYVLFNLPYYLRNPLEIPAVWHGGMAIHLWSHCCRCYDNTRNFWFTIAYDARRIL